jgi:hypothetical protein
MAGLPLGASSPTSSAPAHAATHRNVLSGLQFRKSSEDPRQRALILAPDGWRATGWVNRDLDAHPFAPIVPAAPTPAVVVPIVTRTRRTFAAIPVACGEQLTVQTSRRARECAQGVQLLHGIDGEPDRMAHLLLQPATARMLARALIEAAAAVDQAQRSPVFTRAAGAQGGAA